MSASTFARYDRGEPVALAPREARIVSQLFLLKDLVDAGRYSAAAFLRQAYEASRDVSPAVRANAYLFIGDAGDEDAILHLEAAEEHETDALAARWASIGRGRIEARLSGPLPEYVPERAYD